HFGKGPKKIDRYAALLALRETALDRIGGQTVSALTRAFRECKTPIYAPGELTVAPVVLGLGLIHPYALTAVLPDVDHETAPLHPELENPFERVKHAIGELAGPPALVDNAIYDYGLKRDLPLMKQPDHEPAAPDAVRVAFVDTGVDYVAEKDLGLFLGDGTRGQLSSEDFGGTRGKNAWGPVGLGAFNHGSFTMASLLTLVANMAPDILEKRQLDLAMWKMRSDTILLTGPVGRVAAFTPQMAMKNDFMRKIENAEVKPKIVSISMSMGLWPYMEAAGKKDLIKNAPWLWVMSSGNEGRTLDVPWTAESGQDVLCLEDVPDAHRDDSKILCVGALVQGIVNPKIAEYSNYGKRVDVYAFESYTKLCPNGTSCAAPAVTAAATIIANRFPTLTPSQLKQVIVDSAEEKDLEVGLSDASSPSAKRSGRLGTRMKVKVFNPIGMMDRALKNAAIMAGLNQNPKN
ncbi:MAG: S8 family serine peptidase, partial [Bdellovibrio sp.]|nr:S8 family serine peptidase [Bdellovibrio sp.]